MAHPAWSIRQWRKANMISQPDRIDITPAQGIAHDPYGVGDLYNPGPTERTPHEPEAGVAWSVGAATWPAGAAGRVWVTWRAWRTTPGSAKDKSGSEARSSTETE